MYFCFVRDFAYQILAFLISILILYAITLAKYCLYVKCFQSLVEKFLEKFEIVGMKDQEYIRTPKCALYLTAYTPSVHSILSFTAFDFDIVNCLKSSLFPGC